MRHKAKVDLWFAIAIVFAIVVPVAQEHYWIALPSVLILVTCCCPQSYETTAQGLVRGLQVLGVVEDSKEGTLTLIMGWSAATAEATKKIDSEKQK